MIRVREPVTAVVTIPATRNALSNAERQKRFRERAKAERDPLSQWDVLVGECLEVR